MHEGRGEAHATNWGVILFSCAVMVRRHGAPRRAGVATERSRERPPLPKLRLQSLITRTRLRI